MDVGRTYAHRAHGRCQQSFRLWRYAQRLLPCLRAAVRWTRPSKPRWGISVKQGSHLADTVKQSMRRLIASGQLLDHGTLAARGGMSLDALEQGVLERRFIRFQWDGRSWFPAFMLDESINQEQLGQVVALLGDLSAGSKFAFLTHRRGSLATAQGIPRTPLEALGDGDLDKVMRAADAASHT